jgi:hypothetical protein
MSGIDSFTKLMLHLNTDFTDVSASAHSVTAHNNAQISSVQSKFGGASALFDYTTLDYLSIPDSSDWDLGSNDFTIDCWVYFTFLKHNTICSRMSDGHYFYWAFEYGTTFRFRDLGTSIDFSISGVPVTTNTWYHIAVVRTGNTFRMYLDGIQQGTDYINTDALFDRSAELDIGTLGSGYGYELAGYIDEFRWSKGIARWTSNFTPPTEEYGESGVLLDDILDLSDEILTEGTIIENQDVDIIELSDSAFFPFVRESEEILIEDSCSFSGIYSKRYLTHLNTLLRKTGQFLTDLRVTRQLLNKFQTHLNLLYKTQEVYNTDLRVKFVDYNKVTTGTLDDFIVKLDGIELTDVDYNTLQLIMSLNSTPSRAEFTLARRHDDFNRKLDGTTSIISNENKVKVYDGTTLLFTGYITEINPDSETDTVKILAEDIRYKLATQSMELEYGGQYLTSESNPNSHTKTMKNVGTAYNSLISAMSGLISGADSLPFNGAFIPEYVKSYNSYATLMDDLIRNTANANWYIDANERLRFTLVDGGQIKNLKMSSLNTKRHPYDIIVNNINLNRKTNAYAKSLNVKLGKNIQSGWARREFSGWLNQAMIFMASLTEKTAFCFQQWGEAGSRFYVGINQTIYGYATGSGWFLKPTMVVQYQSVDSTTDLPDINIGSGSPTKTIYLTSYGKKTSGWRWDEQDNWLVSSREEIYDRRAFATDLAYFELSQNNKLQSTAQIDILLDAFKYYGLNFSDRINITNTINSTIYQNNNGFPLNIDSYTIDCSRRIVKLYLTNYGKSFYAKTANYLLNESPSSLTKIQQKHPVVQYSQLP